MNDSVSTDADPYARIGGFKPIAEMAQAVVNGPTRREAVRMLQTHGARSVIDVGCGGGALCRFMADADLSALGVDASPAMLTRARQRAAKPPRFEVVQGSAERLPVDGPFDAAVTSLMLHELDPATRDAVYDEMRRVVAPGGLLLLIDIAIPEGTGMMARAMEKFIHSDERAIGRIHPPHYTNYKEFVAAGGLTQWIARKNARVLETRRRLWGNVAIVAVAVD